MRYLKIVDNYFKENFFFYLFRVFTIPVLVHLWINMFRYRQQTHYMSVNFIFSIILCWNLIGYSMWTIYLYMNYHSKHENDESCISKLLVVKKGNYKRREVILDFILDEIKSSIYVFFLDLSLIVLPVFLIF